MTLAVGAPLETFLKFSWGRGTRAHRPRSGRPWLTSPQHEEKLIVAASGTLKKTAVSLTLESIMHACHLWTSPTRSGPVLPCASCETEPHRSQQGVTSEVRTKLYHYGLTLLAGCDFHGWKMFPIFATIKYIVREWWILDMRIKTSTISHLPRLVA